MFHVDDNVKRLDLVVLSDRGGPNSIQPLKALVNSILLYTTHPINLNVVTKDHYPWLDALNEASQNVFRVYYHSPSIIFAQSQALVNATGATSIHYSSVFAFQKLFLSTLTYPSGTLSKVLMLDDDMVFYEDITPLVDLVRKNPDSLSLYCPVDPTRVEKFFGTTPDNGHTERYCNSGMMGLPLGNRTAELFAKAMSNMKRKYPHMVFRVADQDVVNRYFAEHDDDGSVDYIPCDWSCDFNSCQKKQAPCSNCLNAKKCRGYHFLAKGYKQHKKMGRKEWNWDYYYSFEPFDLLNTTFGPRVEKAFHRDGAVIA
jgi:lipopolysaccharide biosynthesis glycosyltransferase